MIIAARIALAWLLFVGLAYADGTFGVGRDGLTFAVTNGIGKKGSGGGGGGATGYTWAGPSTGTAGSPSTNFTVTASGGTFTGSQTITIADGTKGGTITPSVGSPGTSTVTVTPTNGSSSFTFTYTAVLGDAITLTGTNGQSWSNPSPLTYTGAVTYTATGPSSGKINAASTNFTVSMPAGTKFSGTDTVTIADGSQGGTITPSVGSPGTSTVTVTPSAAATSFTFTYLPMVVATPVTMAFTNAQSWTNPSSISYTSSPNCTQSGNLIARMDGAENQVAVDALICGMVTDGVYGLFDGLYVFATNSTANAQLNWAQNAYNLTQVGALTFTANKSYASDGTTGYFTNGYIPSSAGGHYTGANSNLTVCNINSRTTNALIIPIGTEDGTNYSNIIPLNGGTGILNLNGLTGAANTFTNSNAQGSFIITRSTASGSTTDLSKNGGTFSGISNAVASLPTAAFFVMARNANGTVGGFDTDSVAYVGFGTALSQAQTTAVYNRLHTYLQAVGETTAC